MSDPSIQPEVLDHGLSGLLVRFSQKLSDRANEAAIAFRAMLEAEGWDGVVETSPALVSVFVSFDPAKLSRSELRERLTDKLGERDWSAAGPVANRRLWCIPVSFEGDDAPQLEEAAALAGMSAQEAVAELTQARVRVLTLGFAPGQPYLGQLSPAWDVPRQTNLTQGVPQGALVTAIRQLVLFSAPAPTGWRQVGRAAFQCFRPAEDPPIALRPGDEVTFRSVSGTELRRLAAGDPLNGGATMEQLS